MRIIEIFCVTIFRVAVATGGSGNFLNSSKEMLVAIALLLLIVAAVLAWRSHKKLIQTCLQNRAEIERLERLMLLANAIPLANSDELKVLQVLKQKIQEPETILYPDQSFELPTGMGVEMRFTKLIKRADAIALCDKLARLPDLQVPSATVSWVRSRFLIGIRGLETIVYRNRYGGTNRYILLHEALQLVDELIREFETNHWRSLDSV